MASARPMPHDSGNPAAAATARAACQAEPMKIIYRAENLIDANLVKLALADAGIRAFVSGEQLTGGVGQLPAMDLVTVMVADPDIERARAIAADIDARLSRGEFEATGAVPYDDADPLEA